jgi:hypothetical protein
MLITPTWIIIFMKVAGLPPNGNVEMIRRPAFYRRPECLVALGVLAAVVVGLSMLWNATRLEHTESVIERLPSPDGAWVAVNNEAIVDLGLSTMVADEIHLVSTNPPFQDTELLMVNTGGIVSSRPRLVWSAPDTLQITLSLRDYLRFRHRSVKGLHLDIRFDPDSPFVREVCRRPNSPPQAKADDAVKLQ